jgi:tRNA-Thr(GGU) m(6)t(6)A37 methyltransferase TsaA
MKDEKAGAELWFIGFVKEVADEQASIRLLPRFHRGLKGVEDFSHLIILYWAHLRDSDKDRNTLLVFPRRHKVKVETGVFACRSPSRPNPLGLCVVELLKTERGVLTVKGLDAYEGTPIVDVKPYIPRADSAPNACVPQWTSRGPST